MPGSNLELPLNPAPPPDTSDLALTITLDVPAGAFRLEWAPPEDLTRVVTQGRVSCGFVLLGRPTLSWSLEPAAPGKEIWTPLSTPPGIRGFLTRVRKSLPHSESTVGLRFVLDQSLGNGKAGVPYGLRPPASLEPWKWLGQKLYRWTELIQAQLTAESGSPEAARNALRTLAVAEASGPPAKSKRPPPARVDYDLQVTFDQVKFHAEFIWHHYGTRTVGALGRVRCTGRDQLTWELDAGGEKESTITSHHRNSIREALDRWLERHRTRRETFTGFFIRKSRESGEEVCAQEPPFGLNESAAQWVEDNLVEMAKALRYQFSPLGRMTSEMEFVTDAHFDSYDQKLARKEEKLRAEEARRREVMAQKAQERRDREAREAQSRKAAAAAKATVKPELKPATSPVPERAPTPPVPVHFHLSPLVVQTIAEPLAELQGYFLRERAAQWWVSNQSDDLLCLPSCRIQHLDYQIRTALRVLGPLRGRALLSDEVGLGKTVEAGLIIKELLTRGMVKKILVLTVPSLVDQWEEELNEKFGLTTVTTNQTVARNNPQSFWSDNPAIVASLHTVKQAAQLEIARQVPWDILVVDEAHYLRNRESQAWQAVNALPRHFLLLLTATPVQNSLEELYNLVTLLQPGQLPTPKEFRARFLDPKRPRQPKEPEELRRLLGQVMIRNTRANAGLKLPPRRAETVLFQPDAAEQAFWQRWETELRAALSQLNASQASLWGRLLLQTSGSSPAAWRSALEKFPSATAKAWRDQAPLESSWRRKCELILPLTRAEGGVVIFTQFLETQAALAEFLRGARVPTFVIHGGIPAAERQPITEVFRKAGGALLLTHSGTEGRNLQFSHQLVNFDLPWNPMEIEQRIGRLHRLGQERPVHIYNFVQSGTLQEHLLELLQEKLNLFELVVGETGLVLGERFGSDEFAEEVFRRWRESDGRVAEAFAGLGDELAAARDAYGEVKQLDATLFAKDYETL